MSKPLLSIIVLGVAVAGFGLGRLTAPSPPTPDPAAPSKWSPPLAREAWAEGALRAEEEILDALSDPDPYARAQRLATLLPTLGADAVPAVAAMLVSKAQPLQAAETELLTRFWADHDPESATYWALGGVPQGNRAAVVPLAVRRWASVDPVAAAARVWAATTESNPTTAAAETALIEGWFESGQPGLVQYIRDKGPSFEQQRALAALMRQKILRDGSEATMRWTESLEDEPPGFKIAAYRQLAGALGMLDLDAARRWCEAQCDGPYGGNVRQLIAVRWVATDGVAAMEWLSESPPAGLEREIAVRAAYAGWVRREPEQALGWLEAHGRDGIEPWLRPAVVIYARALGPRWPTKALEWAEVIEVEKEREIVMVEIARWWRFKDELAAEAWVEQSPLSEEARAKARQSKAPPARRH